MKQELEVGINSYQHKSEVYKSEVHKLYAPTTITDTTTTGAEMSLEPRMVIWTFTSTFLTLSFSLSPTVYVMGCSAF